MNIKNILTQLFLLITILFTSSLSAASGLVTISDSKRSICGFLVLEGDKKYLYTSQTALFGMHLTGVGYKFNAKSFSGHPVKIIGPLMVSAYSDVARVEVSTDATDLLKIGKIKDFGEKATIFPAAVTNNSDKPEPASISGIGIDTLTINAKLDSPIPGTPILNGDKEVVGVLSTWIPIITKGNTKKSKGNKQDKSNNDKKSKSSSDKKDKSGNTKKDKDKSKNKDKKKDKSSSSTNEKSGDSLQCESIASKKYTSGSNKANSSKKGKSNGSKKGKSNNSKKKEAPPPPPSKNKVSTTPAFQIEYSGINRGGRLDVNIRWLPAGKVDFIEAGSVIYDSDRMLKEYMPILDWWLKTPYTQVPDNISYPNELKRFVLYNNERTPIIRKLVEEIQENPIERESELNKVRTGCLNRAKLFSNFPINQMRQLNVQWKTPFLRNEGGHYSREWNKIVKVIQAKRWDLEFQVPF